jgi:phosphohistidine phosphatase
MQRRLVLLRHAEAAFAPVDADRPLTAGGAEHAAAIGGWLTAEGLAPEWVAVSPARRAAQTWERAGAQLASAPPPVVDERIYDNTVDALLAVLQEVPAGVGTAVLVGHNPSVGELARSLDDGAGDPAAVSDLTRGYPAGGIAVFDLPVPFAALAAGTARLTAFAVPRG